MIFHQLSERGPENACKNNFGCEGKLTLTLALSHRMGYLFSVVAAPVNGARTSVRRKVG